MPRGQGYRDVHIDTPLSNISIAHWQSTDQFVAGRFFTNVPVIHASDVYTVYPKGYFNRIYDSKRAEGGLANTVGYKTKEEKYSVDEDALRIFISDKKRANADSHLQLDTEATKVVTDSVLLGKEKDFAELYLAETSDWTVKYKAGVGDQLTWKGDSGDPIKEILGASVDMLKNGAGRKPNKGLMTYDLFIELRERADFIERVQYSSSNEKPSMVSLQAMAALFELDEIMLMSTVLNQAPDGVEDVDGNPPSDHVFISEGTFLTAHVAPGAGLFSATAAMTFVWNQYIAHGLNAGPAVRRYRKEDRKGEFIEAELSIDQKIVSPDLGILWTNMMSAAA